MTEEQKIDVTHNAEMHLHHRHSDMLSRLVFGIILIWAGAVFFLQNMNISARLPELTGLVGRLLDTARSWELIALGAGILLLLEVLLRLAVPSLRRPIFGTLILGMLLIGWGTSNFFAWNIFWPVALVVLGLAVLVRAFLPRM